jgi:hypothetical protein
VSKPVEELWCVVIFYGDSLELESLKVYQINKLLNDARLLTK